MAPDDYDKLDDEDEDEPSPQRELESVPHMLSWRTLRSERARRAWFELLWHDVCALRQRYQLPVRCRWWEDEIQVEALAALANWVRRYDSGEWDDPPGKLSLLFELERIEALLRDGNDPFHPHRDRAAFEEYMEWHSGDRLQTGPGDL